MRGTDGAFLLGRLLFGGFFVYSGINHFQNAEGLTGYAASQGVPLPALAVLGTGLLMLVGGLLVAAGAWPRVGLALLIVFLVGVTPVMHAFWTIPDPQMAQMQRAYFLRNLALLGASLALLAVPTPWPLGLGGRFVRAREAGGARP
ncbi:MAG TPA: DoxX family protein, partial [Candidatus Thermoplasmatota archaeon]|nr:DoxX family protein [Candidatus Thermoplasmatota archaeon]